MPNFENVILGAPFEAEFVFRGERRRVVVDDQFEIVIPSLARADAPLAATVDSPAGRHEFRHVDGRLFRPFLDDDGETWTVDRLNEEPPPTFRLDRRWRFAWAPRTSLLGSPWRPWREIAPEGRRARARKAAPQSHAMVGAELQAAAGRGLRFVDGVLHQETRTPSWLIGAPGGSTFPAFPDRLDEPGLTLVDPRLPRAKVSDCAAEMGYPDVAGMIDVRNPSLLPDTVEADALASCCLWLCKRLCDQSNEDYEPGLMREAQELVYAAEQAIRDGTSLDGRYRLIEKLAAQDTTPRTAMGAKHFPELRRLLPPLTCGQAPIDETDADHIASAFSP